MIDCGLLASGSVTDLHKLGAEPSTTKEPHDSGVNPEASSLAVPSLELFVQSDPPMGVSDSVLEVAESSLGPGILHRPTLGVPESEVGLLSSSSMFSEPNPIRIISTSMVRVGLEVEDLVLTPAEATDEQELVPFSDMACVIQPQASPQRMLEVPQCGEEPPSPLTCVPLAIIEPSIQDGAKLNSIPDTEQARSKWVNSHYRGFCKLVGFPIDSHEQ